MKLLYPENLKEFETHLKTAWNIAKKGQIKAVRVRVVSNISEDNKTSAKVILTATDAYVYYNIEVPLKKSEVQGVFYLDLDKNKENQKQTRLENNIKKLKGEKITRQKKAYYFDIEPYLINYNDFPKLEIKKPTNYFATDKNKLLAGLNLILINKNQPADLKVLNKKAILVNKTPELTHKYTLPVLQQNKNYGRVFFNPLFLKEIIKNASQEIVAIWYNKSFMKVGDCFLANIIKPKN